METTSVQTKRVNKENLAQAFSGLLFCPKEWNQIYEKTDETEDIIVDKTQMQKYKYCVFLLYTEMKKQNNK